MIITGWLVGRFWDWGWRAMPKEVELAHCKCLESRLD